MVILFLGRSIEGILADAQKTFPGEDYLVVSREGDQLQPPAGVASCSVSQFQPQAGTTYKVVANGGTTSQLVPTLKRLVEAGVPFEVYDLQRDGVVQLW